MYKVQLDLSDKTVAIIGGGKVAYRKYKGLTDCKHIKIISPKFIPEFLGLDSNKTTLYEKVYEKSDIDDADLIITATDDKNINDQVVNDASGRQLVNHTGDRSQSNFYNMKIVECKNFTISVSTDGESCKKSQDFGKWLEQMIQKYEEEVR
ncbi:MULTISPECIES: precorrin-2 dehydrogenase/sirohydrochlorin ferrochelatase family protein [Staphylococcaceae]|uniref:precorrin-2 dehydrogenase/sirohydrochlorin ferrochelatase family protein n=1 Tax=Staphylococcaceae TaxID=90964 RepID=UPI001F48FEC6|nr:MULTISPECIES: bifunctional precorrin-2 dehydrogenase/sirohydrochlorin ferrochelatase [Staphylococcaceae]MCE5035088.1 bifunctional precorrin-2 dehydrogenase/sirohydrochlorin ferrochelatase [Staphylococcus cohnii]